jgi:hypothetical protein
MDRRRFLLGLAGSGAVLIAPASAQDPATMARLSIEYEDAGRPIARDFIGLRRDPRWSRRTTSSPPTIARWLRRRAADWRQHQRAHAVADAGCPCATREFHHTPSAINRLAGFLRVLGWRLIYGLNLATGTAEEAAAEAAYVARAVGPQLLAFQIGNEPDGFALVGGAAEDV